MSRTFKIITQLILFFFLFFSKFSLSKPILANSKLNVAFYTGLRYMDGLGDLALNKYLIDRVVQLYENDPTINFNIVFLSEPGKIDDFSFVLKIFTNDFYKIPLQYLQGNPNKGSISEGKFTFWKHSAFEKFIKNNDHNIDLAIMASDTSLTLKGSENEAAGYYFKKNDPLVSKVNFVSFLEYSSGKMRSEEINPSGFAANKFRLNLDQQMTSSKLYIQNPTGPQESGMIFPLRDNTVTKENLLSLFRNAIKTKAIKQSNITNNSKFIVSYINPKLSDYTPDAVIQQQILISFLYDKNSNYIVYSSVFKDYDEIALEKFLDNLTFSGISMLNENNLDDDIQKFDDWRNFVKNNISLYAPTEIAMTPNEMQALFNFEYGSVFPFVSGFATLGEAYISGNLPLIGWRGYHRNSGFISSLYRSLINEITVDDPNFKEDFTEILEIMELPRMTLYSVKKVADFYKKHGDDIQQLLLNFTQKNDLSLYVKDAMDAFQFSKTISDAGTSTTETNILWDAFGIDPLAPTTANKFLNTLRYSTEVLHLLDECFEAQFSRLMRGN
ncbi:MAG: hypothetical protein QE271_12685 [Bacteriovoracaceae bacterium]|nr:hypothetical protein [Bacteriovoracaceae bacterium]